MSLDEELETTKDNAAQDSAVSEDEYEFVELEFDEDDIVRYLEDEEGNCIGFVLLEDGEECEYLYVEDDEEDAFDASEDVALDSDESATLDGDEDNPYDLGITKDGVAEATNNMNAIYKDGIAVVAELKGAFDDIKNAFDFSFLK